MPYYEHVFITRPEIAPQQVENLVEDIKTVMSHTTSLVELLDEQYGDVLSMVEPMEFEIEEQQEETEQDAKTLINKENVFYAGTRKGNT